jgi:hypothetical protein
MRRITIATLALGFLFALLASAPAHAQATRTWVSGVGNDGDPCSRTAPCKTFAGAISQTADNGEINCIDPGGFGQVAITKNITIDCGGTFGSILATGGNGILVINGTSSAVLHVIIRNLTINGASGCAVISPGCLPASPGLNGIRFLVSGSLTLDNVVIQNFTAAGDGNGIDFAPNNSSQLIISNSNFFNNGNGSTGAGIRIRPSAGSTTGVIDKSVVARGTFGVAVDTSGGSSGINLTVRQSAVANNNQTNVISVASGIGAGIMVDHTSVSNGSVGLTASGAGAVVRVVNSSITGNGTATSGNVLSYGNNAINGNGVDTVPTPVPGGLH